MTEDHKIANPSERLRIAERGERLKDGETRIYGKKENKIFLSYKSDWRLLKLIVDCPVVNKHRYKSCKDARGPISQRAGFPV